MAGIQEDNKLKVNLKSQFTALSSLIFISTLFLGILIYLEFNPDAVIIFGIFYMIYAIPTLFLHFTYWLKNKGLEYEVRSGELIHFENGESTIYTSKEIKKIIIYKSASMDKGGIPILGIESYYFARVLLNSGEELVLTCLLSHKIDEKVKQLRGVKQVRKKRLFNLLSWK